MEMKLLTVLLMVLHRHLLLLKKIKAFNPTANKKYIDIKINNIPFIVVEKDGSGGFHTSGFSSLSTIIIDAGMMMALSPKTVSGSGDSMKKLPAPYI